MNCLQSLPRTFVLPVKPQLRQCHGRTFAFVVSPGLIHGTALHLRRRLIIKAISSSESGGKMDDTEIKDEKSEVYSTTMTEAMGASLTYRHELGMNYNFIRPDLIVGSCLQGPGDVDKLRSIGVKTIFCLQQDPDLAYFDVDINAIREYAQTYDDIEHIRAEIRDFDKHDLRMRLPAVLGELYRAVKRNGGVTYIHCTAGLGRAPAVALAYMYWVHEYKLTEAHNLLQSKRPSFPKLDAIKSATADILTGLKKKHVTLQWDGNNCSTVELAGLDIGWGQCLVFGSVRNTLSTCSGKECVYLDSRNPASLRKYWKVPLNFDKDKGVWVLERELPEGHYEYKYVVDGEWLCNNNEPLTSPSDGNVNNYVQVGSSDPESDDAKLRKRLMGEDPDLTKDERNKIKECLDKITGSE